MENQEERQKKRDKVAALINDRLKSISQQSIADHCLVSQALVSYWKSAKRLPSKIYIPFLSSLSEDLDPFELSYAAGYHPEGIVETYELITSGDETFDALLVAYSDSANLIRRLWTSNLPEFAIEQALITSYKFEKVIKRNSSIMRRKPLLRMLSDILYEEALAFSVTESPKEAWRHLRASAERLRKIGVEIGEDGPRGWANCALSAGFYELKQHDNALFYALKAERIVKDRPHHGPMHIRSIGLNSANVSNFELFDEKAAEIKGQVESGKLSLVTACMLYEGLSKGHALLDRKKRALESMEEAWKIYSQLATQGERTIWLQLSLLRTQIFINQKIEGLEGELIEDSAKEGRALAKQFGYQKYSSLFTEILNDVLN